MAAITGLQTVNHKDILEVGSAPGAGGGTVSSIGSVAMLDDSGTGKMYLKTGSADTAWAQFVTVGDGNLVGQGTFMRLPIYDLSPNGYHVDDEVTQNSQLINVFIEAQPTRSADIAYRIPNPGDAVTAADFVLTEGVQTINGDKTFGDDVVIQGDLTVNGTLTWINTTNLEVTDKLIRLNKGGAAASGGGSGFEVEEDGLVTGYFKTSADRNGWVFLAPNVAFEFELDLTQLTAGREISVPDSAGTFVVRPTGTPGVAGQVSFFSDANNIISDADFFWDNSTKRLGIGTNTPTRMLDVDGSSIFHGAIKQQDATATKAQWEQLQAQVSTTDNTTTTLATIAIPTDSEVVIEAMVLARQTGGVAGTPGDSAGYRRTARFRNIGGTVTQPKNTQTDWTDEDNNPWSVDYDINTTNVRIRVAGQTDKDIDWTVTYRVYTLN